MEYALKKSKKKAPRVGGTLSLLIKYNIFVMESQVEFEPSRRLERRLPVRGRERGPGCHPERSAGSLRPASQTLRGVYPERSEWAQDDRHYLQMSMSRAKRWRVVRTLVHVRYPWNCLRGGICRRSSKAPAGCVSQSSGLRIEF